MDEVTTGIASAVQEQTAATEDVSKNISVVTQAAASTEEGASNVLASAGYLSTQSETLSSEVRKFLEEMRSI